MRIDKNTTIRLGNRNIVKVKLGDVVIWQKSTGPVDETDYLYIESLGDGNTISVVNQGNGSTDNVTPTLEYSTDKNTWNTITFDWTSGNHTTELPVTLNTGEKMYFRNDTRLFSNSSSKYITFSSTVSSNVGGDIRTLSNYLDVDNETTVQLYMFYCLFYYNQYIVDASNLRLPYTTLAEYCYGYMFYGCTSLTTAPELPATTLADNCYQYMFDGCTSLVNAPTLPATTLAIGCYQNMFTNCSSLTTAPELPATTLASRCYSSMFNGCTSLTSAPALPATTLASRCYSSMFNGCTSLTSAPALPATTLESRCYSSMFNGCSSLTTAPTLPAPTLAGDCYQYMFNGCSKLTSAPALPATTLAGQCYGSMFQNCSSLNNVTVYADDISAYNCTNNWLNGVASSGTFNNYGSATYPTNSPSGIPTGWTEVKPVVGPDYFYIESLGDGNTISVKNQGDGSTDGVTPTLEYSKDKSTWNTITFDWTSGNHTTELPVTLNTGEKMYFRNDTGKFSCSIYRYITFSSTVSSNVGGDIRTLSNYLDVDNETTAQSYMFSRLFYNNTYIVDASNLRLSYTTLANGCYYEMFYNCTALTSAPELPAVNLAEICYYNMFFNCSKLTSAPELPATTLVNNCYQYMFQSCKSLTTAPALPATTLADYCYNAMFCNCTALTSAPELPATNLTMACYYQMFVGCNSLTSVTIYATSTGNSSFASWLSNVSPSGTVYNNGFVDLPKNSESGVPSGWSEVVPEIQSITVNPNTFTIEFNNETVTCKSTLEVVTTVGTFTKTNSVTLTVGENTGDTTRTITKTIPYYNSSYDVTIVQSAIQSITANPDTFTIKSYKDTVKCNSTLTITTTLGTTVTDTNSVTLTVGENTGDTTRTLTETIPYKGSSYQITIVQTANDVKPAYSWNVVSTGTYPFELNTNDYYESTNKGKGNSYSYATLNYSGFKNLVLECINSGELSSDYGIISQPDVQLSESTSDDGATGSTKVFKNFKDESSTNPVQITIPSDKGSHFITIKFIKDIYVDGGNDSLQFKVIEP